MVPSAFSHPDFALDRRPLRAPQAASHTGFSSRASRRHSPPRQSSRSSQPEPSRRWPMPRIAAGWSHGLALPGSGLGPSWARAGRCRMPMPDAGCRLLRPMRHHGPALDWRVAGRGTWLGHGLPNAECRCWHVPCAIVGCLPNLPCYANGCVQTFCLYPANLCTVGCGLGLSNQLLTYRSRLALPLHTHGAWMRDTGRPT
jgi:hypothetical protein